MNFAKILRTPPGECLWYLDINSKQRVQVFQGSGFSGSRFFRVQVFQGPSFSRSGFRVWVQALEVAYTYICYWNTFQYNTYTNYFSCRKTISCASDLKDIFLLFLMLFLCLFLFCLDFYFMKFSSFVV